MIATKAADLKPAAFDFKSHLKIKAFTFVQGISMKSAVIRIAQLLIFALTFIFANAFASAITFQNLDEIQRALNVKLWYQTSLQKRVKVAILDKGFYGYQDEIGRGLPNDTHYSAGPVESPADLKVQHGLVMAQLVTALMKSPDLYLYNAYGYSNLKAAIKDLTAKKVDLVLYSEVWEFGGNRDGKGFINALVNKALDQGITWINAAGNFETTTFISNIQTIDQDWVQLPDQNHSLKIVCENQRGEKCPLRVVLSWNDFKDDPAVGTDKDLDLALTDDFLNIIETSAQKQTSDPKEQRPGYSSYPRETIVTEIKAGTYFLRVKNRSQNFDSNDELIITADGDGLSMPNHSKGKSILNPADNSRVVTVGALDSDRSSYNYDLNKPNLLTMSSVKTSDGEFRGSSNAAAFVAGAIGLVKSRQPDRSLEDILSESSLSGWNDRQRGLPLYWLGFGATMGRCFSTYPTTDLPQQILDAVNVGGVYVQTTAGNRVMTPYDPILLENSLVRYQPNDLILTSPEGYKMAPRNSPYVPFGWVEVFQTPQEATLCNTPNQPLGRIFRLKGY